MKTPQFLFALYIEARFRAAEQYTACSRAEFARVCGHDVTCDFVWASRASPYPPSLTMTKPGPRFTPPVQVRELEPPDGPDSKYTTQPALDVGAVREAQEKAAKYDALNTPEIADFLLAVEREAMHQRDRWGSDHDAGKTDADWFWLIGYLAGKAINKPEKQLHHIITTAAACLNWHAARVGAHTAMRPGIGPDKQPQERTPN